MHSNPPDDKLRPLPEGAPLFSVAVPCCDVAPYLDEAVASLLAQPFSDWECLLYVEESRDGTLSIACRYQEKDARFRVFEGPRTGSCSVPRNRCVEEARGEYMVFLDGDDTLVPGALARVAAAIAARPGADLYPCAIQVHDERTGRDMEVRDNYDDPSVPAELTGPEATLLASRLNRDYPYPQLQQNVFRRQFLLARGLRCIPGLRHQDSEFSPRALYLARRVVPLRILLYAYRIRSDSVQTSANGKGAFLRDFAAILRSLFSFHAAVSREPGFDPRVADCWRRGWLTILFLKWFSPAYVREISRAERRETLRSVFKNGTADFDLLLRGGSIQRRLAGFMAKAFAFHPAFAGSAEFFFTRLYYPLAARRNGR